MTVNIKSIRHLLLGWLGLQLAVSPALLAETILPGGDITTSTTYWEEPTASSGSQVDPLRVAADPEKGTVLEVHYNLAGGEYVLFESKNLTTDLNLSSVNTLQFDLLGDGAEQALQVELKDNNGQTYKSVTISTQTNSAWKTVPLKKTDFNYAFGGNPDEDFAWGAMDKMGFTIASKSGGQGSVTVDNLKGVDIMPCEISPTAEELLVDDCENILLNDLGASRGVQNDAKISTTTAVAPISGSYCIEVISKVDQEGGMTESLNSGSYLDVSTYKYMSFYIQPSAAISGDIRVVLVDVTGFSNEKEKSIPGFALKEGTWTRVFLHMSDFAGLDLSQLDRLSFYQPENTTIYLDRVTFNNVTECPESIIPDIMIDTMDTYHADSAWGDFAQSQGNALTLSTVDGQQDKALRLQYVFTTPDEWKYVGRGFDLNLLQDSANAFRFDYKGQQENNNLEFKIYDDNNTIFVFKMKNVTSTGDEWKTVTIPYENFVYFGGEDKNFDFKKFTKLGFAITKGNGGEGTFWVHNIQYLRKSDFVQTAPIGRVIQQLSIDNNPFAPRTDTARANANFIFILNEAAEVGLRIYDLSGRVVREWEKTNYPAGTHTLTWDGLNRNNRLVRNGLFLYMFTAKGQKHTEKIKNIIAVIR